LLDQQNKRQKTTKKSNQKKDENKPPKKLASERLHSSLFYIVLFVCLLRPFAIITLYFSTTALSSFQISFASLSLQPNLPTAASPSKAAAWCFFCYYCYLVLLLLLPRLLPLMGLVVDVCRPW